MSITPERIMELDTKVKEIGIEIGMEFDEEYAAKHERDWNYWSQLKNGTKVISFLTDDYKILDRWRIRGEFPLDDKGQSQFNSYRDKWPEITVAMDRGPEKIAKAIKSRLMPEYERLLVEVQMRIESSNRYSAGRLAQITKVAEYLGMQKSNCENQALYPEGKKGLYKIEAYNEESVKFEITTSAEMTINILKLLGY